MEKDAGGHLCALRVGGKEVGKKNRKEGYRHSPISLRLDYSVGLRFPAPGTVNRCRILGQQSIVGRGGDESNEMSNKGLLGGKGENDIASHVRTYITL